MDISVRGGTPRHHDSSLCATCKHAYVRESADNKVTIKCERFNQYVREIVVKCGEFLHKSTPWTYELEQIAWIYTPEVHGRKIGFAPPKRGDDGSS